MTHSWTKMRRYQRTCLGSHPSLSRFGVLSSVLPVIPNPVACDVWLSLGIKPTRWGSGSDGLGAVDQTRNLWTWHQRPVQSLHLVSSLGLHRLEEKKKQGRCFQPNENSEHLCLGCSCGMCTMWSWVKGEFLALKLRSSKRMNLWVSFINCKDAECSPALCFYLIYDSLCEVPSSPQRSFKVCISQGLWHCK